ncbi:hypothetical protein ACLMAL_39565, partial [Nocardia sp. CWNU-33]|uniref:hypothetical protein n=1 Tax=Nocardia sp. CWNU-33 TaxID=3392117 RepID=UPI00398EE74F
LDVRDRDVDMIDHFEASFHIAVFLRATSWNVRHGRPVICATVQLGRACAHALFCRVAHVRERPQLPMSGCAAAVEVIVRRVTGLLHHLASAASA